MVGKQSMESNPYAPPTAHVADREPETHGLKHRSVWLMIVFTLISLGLYPLIAADVIMSGRW